MTNGQTPPPPGSNQPPPPSPPPPPPPPQGQPPPPPPPPPPTPAQQPQPQAYQPPPPAQPGYQQYPPQAPVPKKSSGTAKGCLIAAGIVVGIIIVIVVLLVTVIGVGVHKAVKEIEKVTDKKVIDVGVGEVGENGPLAIKVVSWTPSAGDEYNKPAAGKQFIVVDIEIRNISATSRIISTMLAMSIKTPGGFEYDQAAYFPEPSFPNGDIQPGQTARGNVAFEVPDDIGAITFVYEPSLQVGDIVQVKLK